MLQPHTWHTMTAEADALDETLDQVEATTGTAPGGQRLKDGAVASGRGPHPRWAPRSSGATR